MVPAADLMRVLRVFPLQVTETHIKKEKSQHRLLRDYIYNWPPGSFLNFKILCWGVSGVESYWDIAEADDEGIGQESLGTTQLRE